LIPLLLLLPFLLKKRGAALWPEVKGQLPGRGARVEVPGRMLGLDQMRRLGLG